MIDGNNIYQQQPNIYTPTRVNDGFYSSFPTPSYLDKREIIRHQLETNFPTKTTIIFGLVVVILGLTGIGLQIGLIVNQAVHYEIGNGIWGGFFTILNGLIRLNMVRSRTYGSYVIYRNLRIFLSILGGVGLVAVSASNLRAYANCSSPQCSVSNFAMTISMLSIGIVATIVNFAFIFVFDHLLFRNTTRVRLTLGEACSDWKYVCS